MNRSRRFNQPKAFVSGGTYDSHQQYQQQSQQYGTPQRQQSTNNQEQTPVQQQKPTQQQQQQQQPHKVEVEDNSYQEEQRLQVEDVDAIMQNNGDGTGEQKSLFKKLFGNRKKTAASTREKKIRQNRRLRKAIVPKNALMALHEVKGIEIGEFVASNSPNRSGFIVTVTINNFQYEGRGNSKAAAKNNACEKALRDYVIAKMRTKPRLSKANSEASVAMETDVPENGDAENTETTTNEEDDVPMVNLASFALYKLFSEWESEGFVIPEMHRPTPNGTDANNSANEPKKPSTIRNELPNNWETMHPSTLLCMMRPGLTYKELGTVGEKPNESHNFSVTVDGTEYKGSGRTKKNARRNAAVSACNTLFNTNFIMEGTV